MIRVPRLLLPWCAAPAVLLGIWLMRVADAPRSVQIQQAVVASVAAAAFLVTVRPRPSRDTGVPQWVPLSLGASLFIPLLAGASDGPERWLVLGGARLYVAPVVLPLAVFLPGAAQRLSFIDAASVMTAAFALVLQPDASQLTAFAAAMLALLATSRASLTQRVALMALLLGATVVGWRMPDQLGPVRYVEGVFSVAASVSAFVLLAALVSAAMPVVAFVWVARVSRSGATLAVAVYYATLFALAPLQLTPVPLLGFGAGPVLGYFVIAGVVSRTLANRAGRAAADPLVALTGHGN